jgi:uncharacterized protein
MRYINSKIRFSPSDLAKFLDSEFSSWMDRWYLEKQMGNHDQVVPEGFQKLGIESCQPDEEDEALKIIADKGIEHEKQFLESIPQSDVVTIPRGSNDICATLDALRAGPNVIFQAHLVHGQFGGFADFLMKVPGSSNLGDYHYEVADTKLAKSPKPYFIVQLCSYADLLEQIQGARPKSFEVILGTGDRERFETDRYFFYYQQLKQSFLDSQSDFNVDAPPHPGHYKSFGRWSEFAAAVLDATDHLSGVAKITRSQIKKLEAVGVQTMTSLATNELDYVPKLAEPTLRKLQQQARLQIESLEQERPLYEVIPTKEEQQGLGLEALPPASPNDVFFDMEGYPLVEGGLEYLFGATHFEFGKIQFADWWAHDEQQEKRAFEGFVDWAHARWKADRSMHIYHYADYEVSTLQRLMGNYATRESKVDDLLRNGVFVDLYAVLRQGVVVGTPSYSLKYIERLYMEQREGEVTTSGGSIVAYHRWLESGEAEDWQSSPMLREIRDYNEVDCVSTWKLAQWLRDVQQSYGIEFSGRQAEESFEEDRNRNSYNADAVVLADHLMAEVGRIDDDESARIQKLLAGLLEFHWREVKPVFWRKHAMSEMTDVELIDDQSCLGSLTRIDPKPQPIKRSFGYRYKFEPSQQTKLGFGSKCLFATNVSQRTEIVDFDPKAGTVQIKLGPSAPTAPPTLSLIPDEYVSSKPLADAVYRYVECWTNGRMASQAIDDLICRRTPKLAGHAGGPLVSFGADVSTATVDLIRRMEGTTLCIQGPPGTGKTYTAAKSIVQLLRDGKRIAVTANGHKAILNVLEEVQRQLEELGESFDVFKAGGSKKEATEIGCEWISQSKDVADRAKGSSCVVGGTAWVFSREELEANFDYLFIDEAGQFSLANVVATGGCASNIVLVGDQMQLASPVQGTHPGECGESALEYYLDGKPTIPPEFGVLLDQSWRMHPNICTFISDSIHKQRTSSCT